MAASPLASPRSLAVPLTLPLVDASISLSLSGSNSAILDTWLLIRVSLPSHSGPPHRAESSQPLLPSFEVVLIFTSRLLLREEKRNAAGIAADLGSRNIPSSQLIKSLEN